jgi:hypothetical protein
MLVNQVGYTRRAFEALSSNRLQAGWGQEPAEILTGDGNEEIAEFLAEIFTQPVAQSDEHLYKLTVAVAEKLFAADLLDGLLYPTVAMRANADNFALKPRYADNHLRFLKAEFARIDGVRDFAYDITALDTATTLDDDGTIRWKGRLDIWVLRNQGDQLTFQVENGEWVARDPDGNIVKPE